MKKIVFFILFLIFNNVLGQQTEDIPSHRFLISKVINKETPSLKLSSLDMTKISEEDIYDEANNIPPRFGDKQELNISIENSGKWTPLPNGDRLWSLKIEGNNILSINLLFDIFWIPNGGELYIYNENKTKISLMNHSNNKGGKNSYRGNASDIIYGSSIFLEYYQPKGTEIPKLSIKYAVQGYRYIEQLYSKNFSSSGACQVNINCPEGDNWQQEKNAVAMIIVSGYRYCTGALIKSIGGSKKLFLTADHCLGGWANQVKHDALNNNLLDHWTFWWNYETPECHNTNDLPNYVHTSGATVLANNSLTDFALLELDENPADKTCELYYLGWDRETPTAGGVGIHHPAGDVKKISTHNITPLSVENNNFHRIFWSQTQNGHSVTEGGSSGSPLLNNKKRIIGQLFGGNHINCANPSQDNGDYGKLSVSWNVGNVPYRRLKDWLDPNNLNAPYTDGTPLTCNADLYVKDNSQDTGEEPNTTTHEFWESVDMWVRNNNDSGTMHQNPIYKANGQPNFIKIRVRNRGGQTSTGYEKLVLNWAKASTALTGNHPWQGGLYYNGNPNAPLGGVVDTVYIPQINGNQGHIVTIPWVVPNPYNYQDEVTPSGGIYDRWHFCLLAKIVADTEPMHTTLGNDLGANVLGNNNIAQKNVTVNYFENIKRWYGGAIVVGNYSNTPNTMSLNFGMGKAEVQDLLNEAELSVYLSNEVYQAWVNGGSKSFGFEKTTNPRVLKIVHTNARLENLKFNSQKVGIIDFMANFLTEKVTKTNFKYVITQTDNQGVLIGGETFEIYRSPRGLFSAMANDRQVDKNEPVTLSAQDINESAKYNWYDSEGNLVHEGADFSTSVDIAKTYKLEVIALEDGYKDYKDVTVGLNPNTIKLVHPNPVANIATVQYQINSGDSAYLSLVSLGGVNYINNYILDINSNSTQIDLSLLPSGVYVLSLVSDGVVSDSVNLIKE